MDIAVELMATVLDKSKIYPEAVPSDVQAPFIHYTDSSEPNITCDGSAGDTTTTVISVCAWPKSETVRLAREVISAMDHRIVEGFGFYYQNCEYTLFDQEKIWSCDLTFKIL